MKLQLHLMRKTIIKIIFSYIIIIFASINCFTQKQEVKPDFSGTWILNADKSDAIADESLNYEIVISQTGSELKISQRSEINKQKKYRVLVIYTDKRGETNIIHIGNQKSEVKSQTFWKNEVIIRKYSINNASHPRSPKSEATEKYILSKDKQILTLTVEKTIPIFLPSPYGPFTQVAIQKYVYKRE